MFIISEISPQFGNSLETAEQMILQSKLCGANAAKVQLYPAELFFSQPIDPYVKSRDLQFDDFRRLKNYGDSIGIPVFATAFDDERLEWCIKLDQAYYKVAARQHSERPDLVERILSLERPTFVSVPSDHDVSNIEVKTYCTYLYCTVKYPTLLEDVQIPDFANTIFSGISDHSVGIAAALMAAARGATHLEKHFTISHAWQRSNEKAHLGAMDAGQLELIARIAGEMERIPTNG